MLTLCGVNVEFPYEPYEVQKEFMERVIHGIQNSQNAVLESPTGTGKTISLLCSSLAVKQLQNKEEDDFLRAIKSTKAVLPNECPTPSKVMFTSRTHSQLKQSIAEVNRTKYKTMKSAVLGSRTQLCINMDAKDSGDNIHSMCKSMVKKGTCTFHNCYAKLKHDGGGDCLKKVCGDKVMDIEDLVSLGRTKGFCPYFVSQFMAEDADVVFSPYNYVLDERTHNKTITDTLQNATIIFDECHNIPKFCEDVASVEFDSKDILKILEHVKCVIKLVNPTNAAKRDFTLDQVIFLRDHVQLFQAAFDEIQLLNGFSAEGDFIFNLMLKSDIGFHKAVAMLKLIDKIIDFLTEIRRLEQCAAGLRKFKEILWVPFSDEGEAFVKDVKDHYRFYAALERDDKGDAIVPHVRKYHFWCFSAKFVLEKLVKQKRTRSLIFTSGTVSPIDAFVESLCIPIGIKLQCNHIISQSQVFLQTIPIGIDDTILDSSYNNRSQPDYILSLGGTILALCDVIPDGVLIFFPSYKVLEMCKNHWQDSGIWTQIHNIKPIFVEPKTKDEYLRAMEDYYANIEDPRTKGAIFIGVCRGKVAEGMDFADKNGRAVIITGIPYPPCKDPKVAMKRAYLDDINGKTNGYTWYGLEASRAVNQAIGRVIRHRDDFGAILLLDCRFARYNGFPGWLRQHVRAPRHYNFTNAIASRRADFTKEIARFFRQNETPGNGDANHELEITTSGPVMSAIEYNLMYENEM